MDQVLTRTELINPSQKIQKIRLVENVGLTALLELLLFIKATRWGEMGEEANSHSDSTQNQNAILALSI